MRRAQDKVIILRKIKYGESDLILHALSSNGGRINFIAKGALKSRKRFGGGILEPLHLLKVNYSERSGDSPDLLHWLEEAVILDDFAALKTDYDRLEVAFSFLQTFSKVVQEGLEEGPQLFDLLGHALKAAGKVRSLRRLRGIFFMKLLWLQGVLPAELQDHVFLKYKMTDVDQIAPEEFNDLFMQRINFEIESYLQR